MAHVLAIARKSEAVNNEDLAAIALSLGLPAQAQRYSAPHSVEQDFTPLAPDEWLIWQAFCPTGYRTDVAEPMRHQISNGLYCTELPLAEYKYDTIPPAVLKHWQAIKQNYGFDSFQIRTTEKTQFCDPILIGLVGAVPYLLARWGLESPESMPFAEVRRRLRAHLMGKDTSWVFWNSEPTWSGLFNRRVTSRKFHGELARALGLMDAGAATATA